MRRFLPILLAVLTGVPAAAEGEREEGVFFEMSRATVLASPGTPRALDPFLPGGRRPGALKWPLPDGPLLVLGLPGSDPAARQIAELFGLPTEVDDLAGGYRIWAWRDDRRPVVFVFGSDPAALYASRFEFDASAPTEMMAPDMRSLDFKQPNQEAGMVVRGGRRHVRPRYRMRAWAPGETEVTHATHAAGARANRLWIQTVDVERVREARAHGVTPVRVLRLSNWMVNDAQLHAWLDQVVPPALRRELRHYALIAHGHRSTRPGPGVEAHVVTKIATWLRAGGLDELTVVPWAFSDELAKVYGAPPDLRRVPEAVIAWSGPATHSARISRTDAERRVRAAGVPVVLYDTWAEPFQGKGAEGYLPARPYGRDPDLHEVLDGVVVVGTRGTSATLESAWASVEADPFGAHLLGSLVATETDDVETFLTRSAMRIEKEVTETMGLVRWMAPLAASCRAMAKQVHDGSAALGVPVVPAETVLDGRVDEPAWGFARAVPTGREEARVLLMSDGRTLRIALRVDSADAMGPLELALQPAGQHFAWTVGLSPAGVETHTKVLGRTYDPAPSHARAAHRTSAGTYAGEVALDRFALWGEAHLLRSFKARLTLGGKALWPRGNASGLLVITR